MDEQNQIDRMLLDYIDENRDRLVEHVRQMVRIDSVEREARDGAPFGPGVKKALDLALSISRDMGFETVDLDGYIGYAFYGRGEDYVCAMGHVDVVPAGEGWKEPPLIIWKTESYTAGEYWTIKGQSWHASTAWPLSGAGASPQASGTHHLRM